ncbi:MAG: 4Fe-4S binding protein [Epsilonproteobacteria bacterium]|nr:4Fe-4S binding protein [Campylobacterota bacterium]
MRVENYTQKSGLFEFDRLKCLRNEYFHNACTLCIDICPEEAFHIYRGKLTLKEEQCTACSSCIGGCPTEALSVESFDPNRFVLEYQDSKEEKISKKQNVPCLAIFDVDHYIIMMLRGDKEIVCDISDYDEGLIKETIIGRIESANSFVKEIGLEKEIKLIVEEDVVASRRALFKKVVSAVSEIQEDTSITQEFIKDSKSKIPFKQTLLKNSLKQVLGDLETTVVDGSYPFLLNKEITKACNNCGECVQFCPSEALTYTANSDEIIYQMGKCIDCDICNHICKVDAVIDNNEKEFDLVTFAFDRAESLIKHDLRVCKVCRCAFPYTEGELICSRCHTFENDFGDMFKLASDL